jgi:hypothetical protein
MLLHGNIVPSIISLLGRDPCLRASKKRQNYDKQDRGWHGEGGRRGEEGGRGVVTSLISHVSSLMHWLFKALHFTNSNKKAEKAIVNPSASRLRSRDMHITVNPFSS